MKHEKDMPETTADLMARRAALEDQRAHPVVNPALDARVLELREEAARMREEADAIDAQIADIDVAIGAGERHRRAEAEASRKTQLAAAKQELAGLWAERQQEIANFENGTRQAAAALARITELDPRLTRLAANLGGKLTGLSGQDAANRYSGRMVAVLSAAVAAFRFRFGHITWPSSGLYSPTKPWTEDEDRLSGAALNQIMSKEQ